MRQIYIIVVPLFPDVASLNDDSNNWCDKRIKFTPELRIPLLSNIVSPQTWAQCGTRYATIEKLDRTGIHRFCSQGLTCNEERHYGSKIYSLCYRKYNEKRNLFRQIKHNTN